jgi:hypothetical protein
MTLKIEKNKILHLVIAQLIVTPTISENRSYPPQRPTLPDVGARPPT